jgi:predicted cupin superfamily sugar epimerase
MEASEIIKTLDLRPLPSEGGYYRETYRSEVSGLDAQLFDIDSSSTRNVCTAIYYLVVPESFSALHKVKSDEIFHFYSGDPVEMIQIDESGQLRKYLLGADILAGQEPQVVVRRGIWQGLRLKPGGKWSLMGTTVAPGFEFEDFELGDREKMIVQFPHAADDIVRFSRETFEETH